MTGRRQSSRSRGQARSRKSTNNRQALNQHIAFNPGYAQQVEETIETSRERADRARSLEADREIERLLGPVPTSPYDPSNLPRNLKDEVADLPEGYKRSILQAYHDGMLSEPLARYYLDIHHADSDRVPGQGGRASLLKAILLMDSQMLRVSGWRAVRRLGAGGFGDVILWEKRRANGLHPLRMAVKDSKILDHWVDYNHEAHLTRRLIDRGCVNVINVVEWAYIPATEAMNSDGTIEFQEQRHRTCYEFAEYADLISLQDWYQINGLIFPEAFLWHIFYSLANALCYCSRGGNSPRPDFAWDPIGHYDIKQDNIFLSVPDQAIHRLYPCVKLGDFGCAWTVGPGVPEVRHYKSKTAAGTEGYVAPEVLNRAPEEEGRMRTADELLGPQSDIYSVGRTFLHIHDRLLDSHVPAPTAYNDRIDEKAYRIEAKKKAAVMIYSTDLNRAVHYCVEQKPKDRPQAYNLYSVTKEYMERWRTVAEVEASTAIRNGLPAQVFPSSVLYTREDQQRFETDPYFAQLYRQQNLARVSEIFPPAPAQQANTDAPPTSRDVELGDYDTSAGRTVRRDERRSRVETQAKPKRNFGFAGVMKKIAKVWSGGRR